MWCAASFGTRWFVWQIWISFKVHGTVIPVRLLLLIFSLYNWTLTFSRTRNTQTHCCFLLLLLQAARNNRTKVNPPSTRCSSTQLFHTPISWHVNMYCINEMACECRLEFLSGTDLWSLLHLNWIQKGWSDPTSVPVRKTTYLPRVWRM